MHSALYRTRARPHTAPTHNPFTLLRNPAHNHSTLWISRTRLHPSTLPPCTYTILLHDLCALRVQLCHLHLQRRPALQHLLAAPCRPVSYPCSLVPVTSSYCLLPAPHPLHELGTLRVQLDHLRGVNLQLPGAAEGCGHGIRHALPHRGVVHDGHGGGPRTADGAAVRA